MALDDIKQSVEQNLTNAYDKALGKGATEPENKNLENLASTIESIQGGTTLGYHVRSVINPDGETQTLKITSGENITLQDKTVTPTEDQQTITADDGYFAIENMTIEAIPSDYVGSGVQKLEETTYTPTTTDIVIDANQYLEGTQTIKGDVNLVPENIAENVELFGLVGTHKGNGDVNVGVRKLAVYDFAESDTYEVLPSFALGGELDLSKVKVTNVAGELSITENNYIQLYNVNPLRGCEYAKIWIDVPADGDVTISMRSTTSATDKPKYFGFSPIDVVGSKLYKKPTDEDGYDYVTGSEYGATQYASRTYENVAAGMHFITIKIYGYYNSPRTTAITSIVVPESVGEYDALSKVTLVKPAALRPENIAEGASILGVDGAAPTMATALNTGVTVLNDAAGAITDLRSYAFYGNTEITSVNLTGCLSVRGHAFQNCSVLTSVSLPACTSVEGSAYTFHSPKLTYVELPKVTDLGLIFRYHSYLLSVSAPIATKIGTYGFAQASKLQYVYAPLVSTIHSSTFYSCSGLLAIGFSKMLSIPGYAFQNCSKLSVADFPAASEVGSQAFSRCYSLQTISLPECLTIYSQAFVQCSNLASIDLPKCTSVGYQAFVACGTLSSVSLPECATLGQYGFQNCLALTKISLPKCTTISNYAFYGCTNLSELVIGSSCTLGGTSVFYSTAINSGHIYVPSEYVEAYKVSANWSAYADRITSIENLPIE